MAEPILQFFSFAHLPPGLKEVSEPFHNMASDLVDHDPCGAISPSVNLRVLALSSI
jgi:hypothetical protein